MNLQFSHIIQWLTSNSQTLRKEFPRLCKKDLISLLVHLEEQLGELTGVDDIKQWIESNPRFMHANYPNLPVDDLLGSIDYFRNVVYKLPDIAEIIDWITNNKQAVTERLRNIDTDKLIESLKSLDELIGMEDTKRSIVDQLCFLLDNDGDTDGHLLHTILRGPPGTGKCLGRGTRVLLASGGSLPVEEIKSGDLLVGDNGRERKVLGTCEGVGPLYRVAQYGGMDYVVNAEHILSLTWTEENRPFQFDDRSYAFEARVDIPLQRYVRIPETDRTHLRGYRIESGVLRTTEIAVTIWKSQGPYFGFEVDGNGRFLLKDGTVTHNTTLALVLADIWDALGIFRKKKKDTSNVALQNTPVPHQSFSLHKYPPDVRDALQHNLANKEEVCENMRKSIHIAGEVRDGVNELKRHFRMPMQNKPRKVTTVKQSEGQPSGSKKRKPRTESDEQDSPPKKMKYDISSDFRQEIEPTFLAPVPIVQVPISYNGETSNTQEQPKAASLPPLYKNYPLVEELKKIEDRVGQIYELSRVSYNMLSRALITEKERLKRSHPPHPPHHGNFLSHLVNAESLSINPMSEHSQIPKKHSTKVRVVSRVDCVAEYMGQTAIKTKKLLEACEGGVIIFEEAYSLFQGERDSFGSEALNVINQWMSERPSDLIFIFLGYKDMLEQSIFKANAGLKRRFGWTFDVAEYKPGELAQIFRKQVESSGWKLDKDIDQHLDSFIRNNMSNFKNFGGDTHRLLFQCKLIHGRYGWKRDQSSAVRSKTISKPILQEAFEEFKKYAMVHEHESTYSHTMYL
jgi:hypothetical protein